MLTLARAGQLGGWVGVGLGWLSAALLWHWKYTRLGRGITFVHWFPREQSWFLNKKQLIMSTGHHGKMTYRKMLFLPLRYVRICQNMHFFLHSISKLLNIDMSDIRKYTSAFLTVLQRFLHLSRGSCGCLDKSYSSIYLIYLLTHLVSWYIWCIWSLNCFEPEPLKILLCG